MLELVELSRLEAKPNCHVSLVVMVWDNTRNYKKEKQ